MLGERVKQAFLW